MYPTSLLDFVGLLVASVKQSLQSKISDTSDSGEKDQTKAEKIAVVTATAKKRRTAERKENPVDKQDDKPRREPKTNDKRLIKRSKSRNLETADDHSVTKYNVERTTKELFTTNPEPEPSNMFNTRHGSRNLTRERKTRFRDSDAGVKYSKKKSTNADNVLKKPEVEQEARSAAGHSRSNVRNGGDGGKFPNIEGSSAVIAKYELEEKVLKDIGELQKTSELMLDAFLLRRDEVYDALILQLAGAVTLTKQHR